MVRERKKDGYMQYRINAGKKEGRHCLSGAEENKDSL